MELNQIKQFRVIAHTESISKAAEMLFIAQPSLSQTLKRLENELGTPLFERRGRNIVLNGAGRIFLKYCDEIVTALDSAVKEIGEYTGNKKVDVNIFFESSSLVMLEITEKMRKNYSWSLPHIYLGSCEDWDIKICSDTSPDCGSLSRVAIEEPIGVLIPANHPLASQEKIYKKDLEQRDFLSLSQSDGLTKVISHYCSKAGFKQNITMYIEAPSVMQELLKRNFGIAFAPQYTWYSYYNESLIFKHVEDMPMRHFVHIVMNEKRYITKELQSCYDAISKCYFEYWQGFRTK